jgi:signal transduction histidine kinase
MHGLSKETVSACGRFFGAGATCSASSNELLEISQIETNRLELSPEPVLIRELVNDVMDLMLPDGGPPQRLARHRRCRRT